jgi:mannose-6-phosphate isomerase-like protein (cupin superfamily)
MTTTVRRVVTGHDETGKAIVLMDAAAGNVKVRPGTGIGATLLWVTDETPSDMSSHADAAEREIGVPPPINGSIFRTVEFPPEGEAGGGVSNEEMIAQMGVSRGGSDEPARHPGMHRTASVDYALIMTGEIDMLMDDSEVHLVAGDVVVQQGTNHAWANRGDVPCQIAFVLIGANPPWD